MPDAFLETLRRAWQDTGRSHVMSQSLYDFDLESNLLRIQDRDFIFVERDSAKGLSLPPGTHLIKQIRSTASEVGVALVRLDQAFARGSLMLGTPVEQAFVKTEPSSRPEVVNVTINVSSAHRFMAGERYRLDLNYVVPLESAGPFLLFSGAIQPSDYDIVKMLDVGSATKAVTLLVRRKKPFVGYVFEPAMLKYFPAPRASALDPKSQSQVLRHGISVDLENYRRAHYFTVAAQLS